MIDDNRHKFSLMIKARMKWQLVRRCLSMRKLSTEYYAEALHNPPSGEHLSRYVTCKRISLLLSAPDYKIW
jgi:hypothetical protein